VAGPTATSKTDFATSAAMTISFPMMGSSYALTQQGLWHMMPIEPQGVHLINAADKVRNGYGRVRPLQLISVFYAL
jgi:hypothetical protein